MLKAFTALTLSALLTFASVAPAQERGGIQATIQSQIEAFLEDDFARAFTFASPGIQGFFGSSDRFGAMVRNGYPMVWRPADVQYLDLEERSGTLVQKVLIRDQAGVAHLLEYQMIRNDGNWRINGVRVLQAPGVGA